jgi:hypothetical protein
MHTREKLQQQGGIKQRCGTALCMISGDVNDIFALQGCYEAKIGILPSFRENLSVETSTVKVGH